MVTPVSWSGWFFIEHLFGGGDRRTAHRRDMTLCRGCDLLGCPTALSYSYYRFLPFLFFIVITSGFAAVVLVVVLPTLMMALLVLLMVAPASRDVKIPPRGSVNGRPFLAKLY